MIFKNISKLLLLIPFFILSCKSLDLISKKEEKIINYNDTIETSSIIQLNSYLTKDSVSLGETGLGLTIGDYDDVGQYTILA